MSLLSQDVHIGKFLVNSKSSCNLSHSLCVGSLNWTETPQSKIPDLKWLHINVTLTSLTSQYECHRIKYEAHQKTDHSTTLSWNWPNYNISPTRQVCWWPFWDGENVTLPKVKWPRTRGSKGIWENKTSKTSWWFQPLWKICSSNCIIIFGVKTNK